MAAITGRVAIAFSANTLDASPTFSRIDDSFRVTEITVDRGRAYEFDRTETGVATVSIVDDTGAFDPTNTGGTFYGLCEPLKPIELGLYNPVTAAWSRIFRGFISAIHWSPYLDEKFGNVQLQLVDGLAIAASAELTQGGGFGTTPYNAGDIFYPAGTVATAVQTRINQVLDEIGWPSGTVDPGTRQIFTGNVALQEVTYAPRTSALAVMQDAADAEFPGVANLYVNSQGQFTFHGRYARFDPSGTNASNGGLWGYTAWVAGDLQAAIANSATVCPLTPPLTITRDIDNLYTAALCTPNDPDGLLTESDYQGNYIESGAVSAYGLRTWSAEGLLNNGGTATTALEETYNIANYYVSNYATPRTRVGPLTFKSQMPGTPGATPLWALLTGVDIGDQVTLQTTHEDGGGFNDAFYVEGVSYTIRPANTTVDYVELTLDVSPVGYYGTDTF